MEKSLFIHQKHSSKNIPNVNFPPLKLRIIKIAVPGSPKPLILITTLLDRKKFSATELRDLYHLRWNQEEFFKTIKEHLNAEQFHGRCIQFIDQELIAIYLYYTLTRIMMMETAELYDIPLENVETKASFAGRLSISGSLVDCKYR